MPDPRESRHAGQETAAYEPVEPRSWDEPLEELPRRPRRRLLGAGGIRSPLRCSACC